MTKTLSKLHSHIGWILLLLALFLGLIASPGTAASAATFTVNNNGDLPDASAGNGVCATAGGECTLRAAIEEANALPGHDTIDFDDSISVIALGSALPSISDQLTLRGIANLTRLDGSAAGNAEGLALSADDCTIQGLIIENFSATGILIESNNNIIGVDGDGSNDSSEGNSIRNNGQDGIVITGTGNRVAGNSIGVLTAITAAPNAYQGILLTGASETLIGTDGDDISDSLERNTIAGNGKAGIYLQESISNTIAGNFIGISSIAIPNGDDGIRLVNSDANTIGTNGDGQGDWSEGNLISGNSDAGVWVDGNDNVIAGNRIGTDYSGGQARPNGLDGIYIENSTGNRIGTNGDGVSDEAEANLISGNGTDNTTPAYGIQLYYADGNSVAGNLIGTDADGTFGIQNLWGGILIEAGSQNVIGTNGDGASDIEERNLISGNNGAGVSIIRRSGENARENVIAGNYIGTSADGQQALPNSRGVYIQGGYDNWIGIRANGISDWDKGNLISGNDGDGVLIEASIVDYPDACTGNMVAGNYIGTGPDGFSGDLGHPESGIAISGEACSANIIGHNADSLSDQYERNIVGNNNRGILVDGLANFVRGNVVGATAPMLAALPNRVGIVVMGSGHLFEENLVSGNEEDGMYLLSYTDVTISDNYIGCDGSLSQPLPNGGNGIALYGGPGQDSLITGNLIAFNLESGVAISETASQNSLWENAIFENGGLGIDIDGDGVTPNDAGDGDSGSNQLQNFPLLNKVTSSASGTTFEGTLDGVAGEAYRVEFFSNASCDASGYGEGRTFLGFATVTANASGAASFDQLVAEVLADGVQVTATATDEAGNTSEFSPCAPVASSIVAPDIRIADASLSEGDSGLAKMAFQVTLSTATSVAVEVDFTTADGTASYEYPGWDYYWTWGTLTFAAGETSKTIEISVVGDSGIEPDETFQVVLSNPVNAVIVDDTATGTIRDDDDVQTEFLIFAPLILR